MNCIKIMLKQSEGDKREKLQAKNNCYNITSPHLCLSFQPIKHLENVHVKAYLLIAQVTVPIHYYALVNSSYRAR
jgi:hypothetical protein